MCKKSLYHFVLFNFKKSADSYVWTTQQYFSDDLLIEGAKKVACLYWKCLYNNNKMASTSSNIFQSDLFRQRIW